jgi:hypothetical protein
MASLTTVGPRIKSICGMLSDIGRDQSTEVIDLYSPLLKIKNQKSVWVGINLIFPSKKELLVPVTKETKCYIATFHGDPIDSKWIKSTSERLLQYDKNLLKNFIVCSNYPNPQIPQNIKHFQIEHLHLLPKFYGNSNLHLSRPAKYRQFNFSFYSFRPSWYRTALFICLYRLEKAILSFPNNPDLNDKELRNFLKENDIECSFEDLESFLPLPVDNYFESNTDLQHAWSVNNIAYQNCLINVVNESSIEYTGHMSEKSFKPLISKTLPIYSNQAQISRLREFGFKINSSFYDNHPNSIIRQVNTLKNLLKLPNSKLIDVVNEYADHNRDWFFNNFYDKITEENQGVLKELVEYVKNIVD